jgi:hypothetical protein
LLTAAAAFVAVSNMIQHGTVLRIKERERGNAVR